MSNYEFFKSCLKTTKEKYDELLNTPRARAGNLTDELKEIQDQIKSALYYDELTEEQGKELLKEFSCINFDELAKARQAKKQGEKCNVRYRFGC